jgi:acyl-coenzyme A synthetase/AMP-(fatty) acid ligase
MPPYVTASETLVPPPEAMSRPAIVGLMGIITFERLLEEAHDLRRLLARKGVTPGEPVLIGVPDGPSFVVALLGTLYAGAVPVPSPMGSDQDFSLLIDESTARFVVNGDDSSRLTVEGTSRRQHRPWLPFHGQAGVLRFSSGTTGLLPKGVALDLHAVIERTELAREALLIDPGDRVLWCLPMSAHFVVSILLYIRNGITLCPVGERPLLAAAQEFDATVLYCSPLELSQILDERGHERWDSLQAAYCTAGPLEQDPAREFFHRFGTPLMPLYGMVEVGLPFAHAEVPRLPTLAAGSVAPFFEIELIDTRSVVGLPNTVAGHLSVRAPGIASGYVRGGSIQSLRDPEGWVETGDLVAVTADGYQVIGRAGHSIAHNERWIIPEVFEALLNHHPGIRESRVEFLSGGRVRVTIAPAHHGAGLSSGASAHIHEILEPLVTVPEIVLTSKLQRTQTGKIKRSGSPPLG